MAVYSEIDCSQISRALKVIWDPSSIIIDDTLLERFISSLSNSSIQLTVAQEFLALDGLCHITDISTEFSEHRLSIILRITYALSYENRTLTKMLFDSISKLPDQVLTSTRILSVVMDIFTGLLHHKEELPDILTIVKQLYTSNNGSAFLLGLQSENIYLNRLIPRFIAKFYFANARSTFVDDVLADLVAHCDLNAFLRLLKAFVDLPTLPHLPDVLIHKLVSYLELPTTSWSRNEQFNLCKCFEKSILCQFLDFQHILKANFVIVTIVKITFSYLNHIPEHASAKCILLDILALSSHDEDFEPCCEFPNDPIKDFSRDKDEARDEVLNCLISSKDVHPSLDAFVSLWFCRHCSDLFTEPYNLRASLQLLSRTFTNPDLLPHISAESLHSLASTLLALLQSSAGSGTTTTFISVAKFLGETCFTKLFESPWSHPHISLHQFLSNFFRTPSCAEGELIAKRPRLFVPSNFSSDITEFHSGTSLNLIQIIEESTKSPEWEIRDSTCELCSCLIKSAGHSSFDHELWSEGAVKLILNVPLELLADGSNYVIRSVLLCLQHLSSSTFQSFTNELALYFQVNSNKCVPLLLDLFNRCEDSIHSELIRFLESISLLSQRNSGTVQVNLEDFDQINSGNVLDRTSRSVPLIEGNCDGFKKNDCAELTVQEASECTEQKDSQLIDQSDTKDTPEAVQKSTDDSVQVNNSVEHNAGHYSQLGDCFYPDAAVRIQFYEALRLKTIDSDFTSLSTKFAAVRYLLNHCTSVLREESRRVDLANSLKDLANDLNRSSQLYHSFHQLLAESGSKNLYLRDLADIFVPLPLDVSPAHGDMLVQFKSIIEDIVASQNHEAITSDCY